MSGERVRRIIDRMATAAQGLASQGGGATSLSDIGVEFIESDSPDAKWFYETAPELSVEIEFVVGHSGPINFRLMDMGAEVHGRTLASMFYACFVIRNIIVSTRSGGRTSEWPRDHRGERVRVRFQTADASRDIENTVGFQKRRGDTRIRLIPDLSFFTELGYRKLGEAVVAAPPWHERSRVALWRGSTTGELPSDGERGWRRFYQLPRVKLSMMAASHPELLDAGLTGISQVYDDAERAQLHEAFDRQGLMRQFMPMSEMAGHRLLIDIDGNVNAWGFLPKMLLGSCILKVASSWEQWFYDELRPWQHFVPVKADLSDLCEKIVWCTDNDEAARAIALHARSFAQERRFPEQMRASADQMLCAALGCPPG